jgi:hypothetical protein
MVICKNIQSDKKFMGISLRNTKSEITLLQKSVLANEWDLSVLRRNVRLMQYLTEIGIDVGH